MKLSPSAHVTVTTLRRRQSHNETPNTAMPSSAALAAPAAAARCFTGASGNRRVPRMGKAPSGTSNRSLDSKTHPAPTAARRRAAAVVAAGGADIWEMPSVEGFGANSLGSVGAAIELRSRLQELEMERKNQPGGGRGDGWEEIAG